MILQVGNLSFGYAGEKLFEGVSFQIEAGDRVGLVAPNGAGKSTLLRLITGELQPDAGFSSVQKGKTVAYYRQSHELSSEGDVMDAFLSGFQDVLDLRHALRAAEEAAAAGTEEALDALQRAMDRYHLAHGDELERRVTMLAERLGFAETDMRRSVASLSGGERGRLLLGVVLAKEPDLLLLDEPTNHLDLDTIEWLEGYLRGLPSAVLVVSHDRAFLDQATTSTLELGRRSFRGYPVPYSRYEELRAADMEREEGLFERQQAFIDKTEDFIRRNIAGQKTKQAQSRRKMLEKLDREARPEDVWSRAEQVTFRFVEAPRSGDIVLDARGLAASRGGRTLFEGVELLIKRGDRVGIVGPNGAGKSTLLKLLAGMGAAEDRGRVKLGTNLASGYFDQHLGELDPAKSLIDEIRSVKAELNVDGVRQYLARFRFWKDDPFRAVGGLSGGERSRLALAKLLLEPRNLLFLDEPTNHLDIPAAEILEEALASFDGTVLLVSHDRRFLEGTATRVLHVAGGAVSAYAGPFAAWSEQVERAPKGAPRKTEPPPEKQRARGDFERSREERRTRERKERRLKELEDEIAASERELGQLRDALKEAPGDDWEELAKRAEAEQALQRRVEAMMTEWSDLSEELAHP